MVPVGRLRRRTYDKYVLEVLPNSGMEVEVAKRPDEDECRISVKGVLDLRSDDCLKLADVLIQAANIATLLEVGEPVRHDHEIAL